MSHHLKHRQDKIQQRRKRTSRRDYLMEIASWSPMNFSQRNGIVSKFPLTERSTVTSMEDFVQGRDALPVGVYTGSFFDDFASLFGNLALPSLGQRGPNENTTYGDIIMSCRNVYLSIGIISDCSDVLYSRGVKFHSQYVIDSSLVLDHCEHVFSCVSVTQSYKIFYSKNIANSHDVWFSHDLVGCHECLLCDGLENMSYCIQNKQYEPNEYEKLKCHILQQKNIFETKYRHILDTPSSNQLSENVSGVIVTESSDVEGGMFCHRLTDARNAIMVSSADGNNHCYDVFSAGSPRGDYYFAGTNYGGGDHYYCSSGIVGGTDIYYSYFLDNCSYCLGCVGLQNKSYCILNQQYEKDERYQKVDEIFGKMESDDVLGDFFPGHINPFYFNDTAACLIDDSFTKEEVTAKGYLRRDEPIKVDIPEGATVVKTTELDQYEGFVISTEVERSTDTKPRFLDSALLHSKGHGEVVWYIDPEILKVIIQDEEGNVYRIVQMEYDFLLKHGLPLPRKHWLKRMQERFRIA